MAFTPREDGDVAGADSLVDQLEHVLDGDRARIGAGAVFEREAIDVASGFGPHRLRDAAAVVLKECRRTIDNRRRAAVVDVEIVCSRAREQVGEVEEPGR